MVFSHPSRLIHPQISVGWAPPVPQLFPTSVIAFGLPALRIFQTPAIWLRGCPGQHTLYGPIAVLGHGFWALASRYHQSNFIVLHIPTGLMVSLEWWLFPTSAAAGMTIPFTCLTKMSTLALDPSDILNIKLLILSTPSPSLHVFIGLFIMAGSRQRALTWHQTLRCRLAYTSRCTHSCWVSGVCWISVKTLRIGDE